MVLSILYPRIEEPDPQGSQVSPGLTVECQLSWSQYCKRQETLGKMTPEDVFPSPYTTKHVIQHINTHENEGTIY